MARLVLMYDPSGEAPIKLPDKPPLGFIVIDVRDTPERIKDKSTTLKDLLLNSISVPDKKAET